MRIEAYSQISQVYKASKASGAKKAVAVPAGRDEVQISSLGCDYQVAKQAVAEAPDIREDKVEELSARIRSGSYSVDVGDFAEKLLEKYRSLSAL